MKKLITLSILLIIAAVFYYYNEYSSYSVTTACVEITNSGRGEIPSVQAEENGICMKIRTGANAEKKGFYEKISGIRYKVIFVVPEKKNDDHLGKSDDTPYEEPEQKEDFVIKKDVYDESPDILVVVINGNEAEGFTKEDILESVINIQNLNPGINLIITDRFEIPSEKIVLQNAQVLDVNGISSVITIKYKVILDNEGKPFSIKKVSMDRRYPDTGKI